MNGRMYAVLHCCAKRESRFYTRRPMLDNHTIPLRHISMQSSWDTGDSPAVSMLQEGEREGESERGEEKNGRG